MKNELHELLQREQKNVMDALEEAGYEPFDFRITRVQDDYYEFRISGMACKKKESGDSQND